MPKAAHPSITSPDDDATLMKRDTPAAEGEVSCFDLIRMLPALYRARGELDEAIVRSPDRDISEVNTMRRSFLALEERGDAIIRLIMETPARTLPDAAAQLLAVYDWIGDHEDRRVNSAARGIISAFFAVVRAAGIEPEDMAFNHIAPYCVLPSKS